MDTYVESQAPHITSSESLPKIMWKMIAALVPVISTSFFYFGWSGVRITVVSVLAAVVAEFIAGLFLRKKLALQDGSSVLIALLLAMMLPPTLPLWMVGLGAFVAVFVGKEIFGNPGVAPFSPTQVGRVFLQVSFPIAMVQFVRPFDAVSSATPLTMMRYGMLDKLPSREVLFWGNYAGTLGETSVAAILIGGIFLLWQKLIRWEIPLLHLGTLFFLSWLWGYDPWVSILSGGVFLGAFFLITDPATTPLTRRGEQIFAIGTAVLVSLLRRWSNYPEGISFAILFMNALTPWIDRWVKPKGVPEKRKRGSRVSPPLRHGRE